MNDRQKDNSGTKGRGQWAEQQKKGMDKQKQQQGQNQQGGQSEEPIVHSPGAPGDDRTPDQTIGQVAYAKGSRPRDGGGGAGEPETSPLEPEKQGGIGGP